MKKCIRCENPLPIKAERCPNCGQDQPILEEKAPKKKKRTKAYEPSRQTDFGNYYDDILPEDAEELKNLKGDNALTVKLILLGFGVAIALAACITILILLGGDL